MMLKNQKEDVLAVDFGTVNTYFTKCSSTECLPHGIHFSSNREGISTAVLEREGKNPLIGDVAIEEYADAIEAERKRYKFYSQFKPEIKTSEKARALAQVYLSTILENARQNKIELSPQEMQVIFGIPCESKAANDEKNDGKTYSSVLAGIAKNAGYGAVRFVEEPVGALLYHVAMGAISAIDAQKGILVIDFGGGTCDFAIMNGGHIVKDWGDTALGGRLFDDLFFQWFIDENPKMLGELRNAGREIFTLLVDCKDVKEKFSEIISLERSAGIRKTIANYGHLDNINEKTFEHRARNYRKSETFRRYFEALGGGSNSNEAIDLLGWFEKAFVSGFENEAGESADISRLAFEDIQYVILAGGSSLWYFVSDIVKKYIPGARIIRSDRPYATISEGLSIIPALKKRNVEIQGVLKKELPAFMEGSKDKPGLNAKMEALIEVKLESIADTVIVEVYEKEVIPLIVDFRERGGKIEELKAEIQDKLVEKEASIKTLTSEILKTLGNDIEFEIRHDISQWFSLHNICLTDEQLFQNTFGYELKNEHFSAFGSLYTLINNLLAGIAGFVFVIIFSQPVTMIIGFVVAFVAVLFGTDRLERLLEKKVELKPAVAKRLFTDRKLQGMKKKIVRDLSSELKNKNKEFLSSAQMQVSECIEKEIEALNEINTIG